MLGVFLPSTSSLDSRGSSQPDLFQKAQLLEGDRSASSLAFSLALRASSRFFTCSIIFFSLPFSSASCMRFTFDFSIFRLYWQYSCMPKELKAKVATAQLHAVNIGPGLFSIMGNMSWRLYAPPRMNLTPPTPKAAPIPVRKLSRVHGFLCTSLKSSSLMLFSASVIPAYWGGFPPAVLTFAPGRLFAFARVAG